MLAEQSAVYGVDHQLQAHIILVNFYQVVIHLREAAKLDVCDGSAIEEYHCQRSGFGLGLERRLELLRCRGTAHDIVGDIAMLSVHANLIQEPIKGEDSVENDLVLAFFLKE